MLVFLANFLSINMLEAQGLVLPKPGNLVGLSYAFAPATLTGLTIDPQHPMRFDFIVDRGDDHLSNDALKAESIKLIKYFMAGLTVPNDQLWVNLSPFEKDRIIADGLGETDMGRDMLAQDYFLKQLSASLTSPDNTLGSKFWNRVYSQIEQKYGHVQVPVNIFNKIWIVPDKASVYYNGKTAFVVENHLKVMMEEDYMALNKFNERAMRPKSSASIVLQIMKAIILPAVEDEVNTSKNFFVVRQIYNSMILAIWFKNNLKDAFINKVYSNQNKINGINADVKGAKEEIYNKYLIAVKKGAYNFIKETPAANGAMVPRKYFSGGIVAPKRVDSAMVFPQNKLTDLSLRDHAVVAVQMQDTSILENPSLPVIDARILDHIAILNARAKAFSSQTLVNPLKVLVEIRRLNDDYPEIIPWVLGDNSAYRDFIGTAHNITLLKADRIIAMRIKRDQKKVAELEAIEDPSVDVKDNIQDLVRRINDPRLYFEGIGNYRDYLINIADQEGDHPDRFLKDLLKRVVQGGFDVLADDDFFKAYLKNVRIWNQERVVNWVKDELKKRQGASDEQRRIDAVQKKMSRYKKDRGAFEHIIWLLRLYQGKTQEQVAGVLGVHHVQISRYESGREFIPERRYSDLFNALEVNDSPWGITPEIFRAAYEQYVEQWSQKKKDAKSDAAMAAVNHKLVLSFNKAVDSLPNNLKEGLHEKLGISLSSLKDYRYGKAYPTRAVVLKLEQLKGLSQLTLWKPVFAEITQLERRKRINVGNLIWQLRNFLGLTQLEFIEMLNVANLSPTLLSFYENNRRAPTEKFVASILKNEKSVEALRILVELNKGFESIVAKWKVTKLSDKAANGGIDFDPSLYPVKSEGQAAQLNMLLEAKLDHVTVAIGGLRPVIIGVVNVPDFAQLLK